MTQRIPLDHLNSDQYDQLCDELDALRRVARGYCPACGRGDAAPTVEHWEQQKQRADHAETALARVHDAVHIADAEDHTDWQRGYRACAERAHAALGARPAATQATERDCLFRRDGCRPCNASEPCATCDPPAAIPNGTDTTEPACEGCGHSDGEGCGCPPAPAGLRDQIAAALYERERPPNDPHWPDAYPMDREVFEPMADAVLNALTQHLDIGEEQAWCKYCRRAWDSPQHRCESDAERRVYGIAELRDRWLMAGPPPLGTSMSRWWDRRLVELGAALGPEQQGVHRYLSTGCLHGDHAYCQSMTGLNGAKRPGECKHCQARCICGCHQPGPA